MTLLGPLIRQPLKHLYRLASAPEYRAHSLMSSRYRNVPRFTPRNVGLHDWTLLVPDMASFLSGYRWIFVEQTYAFRADNPEPVIIDCGANIGLSVLYFKRMYPKAKITAFEPDPALFRVLERNVHGNGFRDVELVNKAVWSSETVLNFVVEGGDAGHVGGEGNGGTMQVPAVRLKDFLAKGPVDLLKVDIEGAEVEVLHDCPDMLHNVKAVCMEFHSYVGKKQGLGEMIKLFEDRGFRSHVTPAFHSRSPLVKVDVDPGTNSDLQLHLSFFRP
jgi:FkbM family methyltransferase